MGEINGGIRARWIGGFESQHRAVGAMKRDALGTDLGEELVGETLSGFGPRSPRDNVAMCPGGGFQSKSAEAGNRGDKDQHSPITKKIVRTKAGDRNCSSTFPLTQPKRAKAAGRAGGCGQKTGA